MGYLSQKKHKSRETAALSGLAVLIAALTVLSFSRSGFCFFGFFNLFHLYIFNLIVLVYALWHKRFKISFVFAFLAVINFGTLSASANLFLSDEFDGSRQLELVFAPKQMLSETLAGEQIISSGNLILAQKYFSSFAVINDKMPLTLVRVSLQNAVAAEYPLIFDHLLEFVRRQDNPVIIFGNFGLPAWDKTFKDFLRQSGLSVKNRLVFDGFNIFASPDFYVLGFREMGISNIRTETSSAGREISFTASFNPAAF